MPAKSEKQYADHISKVDREILSVAQKRGDKAFWVQKSGKGSSRSTTVRYQPSRVRRGA